MFISVPYIDLQRNAAILTDKDLVSARDEALHAVKSLMRLEKDGGRLSTPSVKMWYGSEYALAMYMEVLCGETSKRGMLTNFPLYLDAYKWGVEGKHLKAPEWWGGPVHWSHMCHLAHVNWDHYGRMFPIVDLRDAFPDEGDVVPKPVFPDVGSVPPFGVVPTSWSQMDPAKVMEEDLKAAILGNSTVQTGRSLQDIYNGETASGPPKTDRSDLYRYIEEQLRKI